jgi:hypothetical protein
MDVPMRIVPNLLVEQIRRDETLPCVILKEFEGIIAIVVEPDAQPCGRPAGSRRGWPTGWYGRS